ncbi:RWD domain-containing protein 2A isoform X1 [Hyperolius riggenbachi]|uniref:RWD domain-containing protein 2A isoform X1 n=1 Tax=Hyperolius riggenbachi TaxID=752182 RepID=UPI0035A37E62
MGVYSTLFYSRSGCCCPQSTLKFRETVMPYCVIEGCPNKKGKSISQEVVILHSFPTTIENIRRWLLNTGQKFTDLEALSSKILEGKDTDVFRLCSSHFSPDCYKNTPKRKKLLKDSVPTIFPPSQNNILINEEHVMSFGRKRQKVMEMPPNTERSNICPKCNRCGTQEKKISRKDSSTQTEEMGLADSQTQYNLSDIGMTEHRYRCNIQYTAPLGSQVFLPTLKILQESPSQIPITQLNKRKRIDTEEQFHESQKQQSTFSVQIPSLKIEPQEQKDQNFTASTTVQDLRDRDEDVKPLDFTQGTPDITLQPEFRDTLLSNFDVEPQDFIPNLVKMRKLIVFESCLDELINKVRCQESALCHKKIVKINKQFQGTAVIVRAVCENGHRFKIFESQPKIKRYHSGNVLLATSIICTGVHFSELFHLFKTFGMVQLSEKSFHSYQRNFAFPGIRLAWLKEKNKLLQQFTGKPLTVAGNGQYDSQGNRAKYCVYSLMDTVSGKILDFEVVQSTRCPSMVSMEKLGFDMCMSRTIDHGLDILFFASDRHDGIRNVMREKFGHINHQFYVWDYAKHISKKLREASMQKSCASLTPWIDTIVNHLSWSIKYCGNDEEKLRGHWRSLMHHVINEHEWLEDGNLEKCSHNPITDKEEDHGIWLREGTPAYEKLHSIVNDCQLISDLKHLIWSCHTGPLEVFHTNVLKSHAKGTHFGVDSLECRTILAVLANNNVSRAKVVVRREHEDSAALGSLRFKFAAPKGKRKWMDRNVYEKNFDFLNSILEDTLKVCQGTLIRT